MDPPQVQDQWLEGHADGGQCRGPPGGSGFLRIACRTPLDLTVSYAFVIVKLKNHAAKGITGKDFALARKIEDVIQWQPGKEESDLEGTPDDPRFKYIKYDTPVDEAHGQ